MFRIVLMVSGLMLATSSQASEDAASILQKDYGKNAPVEWKQYLVDTAAGSVSASGMLGVSGESITTVENVRDLVVGLKGLSTADSAASFALGFSPARSEVLPMSYAFYARDPYFLATLFGAMTLGYAQGDAEIGGADFERRAASVETSFFFDRENDDPVLAFAKARMQAKPVLVNGKLQQGGPCDVDHAPAVLAARGGADDIALGEVEPDQRDPSDAPNLTWLPEDDPLVQAKRDALRACHKAVMDSLRWNRSRASLSYATGWIKAKSGGTPEESLGQTVVAGVTYGFDHFSSLKEILALSVSHRRSFDEPVLDTLGTAIVQEKDSSLTTARLTLGSNKIRALVEVSDTRDRQVTASQRAFKQAVGLDVRIYEAMWINLRWGRQRTMDGMEDETGSLLNISYSPSALLP